MAEYAKDNEMQRTLKAVKAEYSPTGHDLRSALRYWLATELVVQENKRTSEDVYPTIKAAKNQLAIAMSEVGDTVYM